MKRKESKTSKSDLQFITDISLRRKIADSIETTSFLYLKRNEKGISPGFAKEIRRAEILYAASIIEAILIHLFKRNGESIIKTDYKDVVTLPSTYQLKSNPIVVARKVDTPKLDREITLDGLLELFSKNGTIRHQLKGKIDKARKVRNTFHLAKSRTGIRCDSKSVNTAYDAVIETISLVQNILGKSRIKS